MSDSIQLPPISSAGSRPTARRVVATAAASTSAVPASDAKPSHVQVETAQPVEPVVAIEPSTQLTITRDEAANTFVYRSIDKKSGEVVWQYPVEQVLRMAHRLRELEGLEQHKIDAKV